MIRYLMLIIIWVLTTGAIFSQGSTAVSLYLKKDSKTQLEYIESNSGNLFNKLGHHGPAIEDQWFALRLYFSMKTAIDVYSKALPGLELAEKKCYPTKKEQRDDGPQFLLISKPAQSPLNSRENYKLDLEIDPAFIGEKVATNVLSRPFGWRYQKVCTYYGTMIFAEASGNNEITEQVSEGFAPYLEGKKKYRSGHVDFNVFGIWPLELYRQTGNNEYRRLGIALAEEEFENPRVDGLTELARYWVDDMYMVGSLQAQAFKNTGKNVYLDRAAFHLNSYIDSLQRPNGLFFHRYDAPFYWGRGNGWASAAMAEVLLVLPEDHEYYQRLVTAYRKMMQGLLDLQGDGGMWHQLLDNHDSFEEPSCTGMFLFSMITGLDLGIISGDEYMNAVEKGWNALAGFVNEKGEVEKVCMWTNAKSRENYYLRRPRITGDYHGQAAFLWASTALLRFIEEK